MRLRSVAFSCLVSIVTSASCGSGAPGSTRPIPLAELADALAKQFCARLYRCCEASERSIEGIAMVNEAACVNAERGEESTLVTNLQEDVDAGFTMYSADRARECVDSMASRSCRDWGVQYPFWAAPGCAHIGEGLLETGQSCTRDEQCAAGHCESSTCVAPVADGQACSSPQRCGPDSYCGPASSFINETATCIPLAPVGAPCADNDGCLTYNCVIPAGGEPGTCERPTTCNGL